MNLLLAPDVPEIERELDRFMKNHQHARVLGLRSPAPRDWPEHIARGGRRFRVCWCVSELEVREQLDRVEAEEGEDLVLVTPLDPGALGCDVMARLPGGRLRTSDRWSVLKGVFRARDVDARLRSQRWLADLLIARAPVGGYPPVAGSVLDLDTAWAAMQEQVLGFPPGRADAAALLQVWTSDGIALERFASLPEEARREVARRLTIAGGPGVGLLLGAALAGRGSDALPIGLVCGVLFGKGEQGPELREATVRLEPFVGGLRVSHEAGEALAEAARRILTRLIEHDSAAASVAQRRAVALLADVRAEGAAERSLALDLGLDARMQRAAGALLAAATSGTRDEAARAWSAVQFAVEHDRASGRVLRIERLKMAGRLICWLAAGRAPTPRSIADAAAAYAREGGFVDRARHALGAGDPLPEVASVYAVLRQAALARREDENRTFAGLLANWLTEGSRGADPLPVERLLETIATPLAKSAPLLVLVLDGLSFAVWRKLAETIHRLGWQEFVLRERRGPLVAAAVLPSVTEVSRASLLCGDLRRGDQSTERAGFRTHAGLVSASVAGKPPRLFHKADLGSGPELPPDLRDALADRQTRVVGVVHNAVDAQLSGSDQVEIDWSAEGMRQIAALLRVARDAGRIVLVTGDHGHVVEEGTASSNGGAGSRWRAAGTTSDGEIALSGHRVLAPDGSNAIVAAWSERVRLLASRSSGYHGGASPQEVLVPIAVFGAAEVPSGWSLAPPPEPAWWRGAIDEDSISCVIEQPRAPVLRGTADSRQPELFEPTPIAVRAQTLVEPAWIGALLASEIYTVQRRLAGRGAATDDQVRSLLTALSARGGRLSRAGTAQALLMPELRIPGLINAARRLLNVDQAQVLAIDGDEILFDEAMLRRQFGLGRGP